MRASWWGTGESIRYTLIWMLVAWERGGMTRGGASCVIGQAGVQLWFSLLGPKLEAGTKIKEAVNY